MDPITASSDTLMRQAKMTAHDYMLEALHDIDEIFGDGTARKHPELVATCGAAIIAQQIRAGLDEIACAMEEAKSIVHE